MGKAFLLFGAIGAGAAAVYLLDEKEGKKRRAQLKKRFEKGLSVAEELWDEYSDEFAIELLNFHDNLELALKVLENMHRIIYLALGERAGAWSKVMGQECAGLCEASGQIIC